jgi:hypothetical protein
MRHILSISFAALLLALAPLAAQSDQKSPATPEATTQSWTGTLADADCKSKDASQPCAVTAATKSYGLVSDAGQFARFDAQGNTMVAAEIKGKEGLMKVKVTGKVNKGTIQVEQVELEE